MTPQEKDDLVTLIGHVHRDMRFREGGTFCDGEEFDKKEAQAAERAIEYIKKLIVAS